MGNPSEARDGRARRALRALIFVVAAFVVVGIGLLMAAAVWTWSVRSDQPEHVGAVVVLAYGQDRMDKGVELVEDGVSDALVMSVSKRMNAMLEKGNLVALTPSEWDSGALPSQRWMLQCDADFGSFQTYCFQPQPNSTVGEALAVRELAEQNGWDSVAIVTEPSHLNRARAIFEECSGTSVYAVSSGREDGWWRMTWRTAYEMGALAKHIAIPPCS